MPAKNSHFKYGNRDFIFDKKVWNDLIQKEKIDFSFTECNKIIKNCNSNISEIIREENDGFKLPVGLGYICAIRFVPKKPAIDWIATKKNNGKYVYFNNLNTFGFSVAIKWFRIGRVANISFNEIFKFKACRKLSREISKRFRGGKIYSELTNSDFMEIGRLENLYNKKYRKDLKE